MTTREPLALPPFAAERAAAREEGRQAVRHRCEAILRSPAGLRNPEAAQILALDSDLPVPECLRLLDRTEPMPEVAQ